MPIVIEDARLVPIRAKVEAGERLTFEDGLALYGTTDILAPGWLANLVRERLHGDTTYFNVNRHILLPSLSAGYLGIVTIRLEDADDCEGLECGERLETAFST